MHDRIKILVDQAGGTYKFAKTVDIPHQMIAAYIGTKKGLKKPSIPSAEAIAKIIKSTGCDPYWLLFGEGSPFPNTPQLTDSIPKSKITKLPPDKLELLQNFFQILSVFDTSDNEYKMLKTQIDLLI